MRNLFQPDPADGRCQDALHFRRVLVTVRLRFRHLTVFGELEVHLRPLFEHFEASGAARERAYFASLVTTTRRREAVARELASVLDFLDEARTPVILSMLLFVIKRREDDEPLPTTRLELYEMTMRLTIAARGEAEREEEKVHSLVRLLALANHNAGRRCFDQKQVEASLKELSLIHI